MTVTHNIKWGDYWIGHEWERGRKKEKKQSMMFTMSVMGTTQSKYHDVAGMFSFPIPNTILHLQLSSKNNPSSTEYVQLPPQV